MRQTCVLRGIIRWRRFWGSSRRKFDAPSKEFENQFAYAGKEYTAQRMCEINRAKEGTEVLSVYERDFYAGCPVVTRNQFGKGEAYYLAAESDLAFLRAFTVMCLSGPD